MVVEARLEKDSQGQWVAPETIAPTVPMDGAPTAPMDGASTGKTGFMNKLTMLVAVHHLGYHDQVKKELDRLVAFSPLQDGLRQLIAGHNERGLDIFRQLGYWLLQLPWMELPLRLIMSTFC